MVRLSPQHNPGPSARGPALSQCEWSSLANIAQMNERDATNLHRLQNAIHYHGHLLENDNKEVTTFTKFDYKIDN